MPKDKVGAAGDGREARPPARCPRAGRRPAARRRPHPRPPPPLPFYAGCAIPQDRRAARPGDEVAAGFGVRLDEADARRLLRPPQPRRRASQFRAGEPVPTACPGLRREPPGGGRRRRCRCGTRSPSGRDGEGTPLTCRRADRFVPYVGCLADRDADAGRARARPASWPGSAVELAYPSLHNGCCGALGGMYRGATKASAKLLDFAAERERARRHALRALPRQPALGRPRAQARRPRPLLARVLQGRRPGGPDR